LASGIANSYVGVAEAILIVQVEVADPRFNFSPARRFGVLGPLSRSRFAKQGWR
jgi:hypothetical protein